MEDLVYKILAILGASLLMLIIGILHMESVLRFRKKFHGEDPRDDRRSSYIMAIIIWVIATVILSLRVFTNS